MALPAAEKNRKLKAAALGQPMAAETALKKLKKKGTQRLIVRQPGGPTIPDASHQGGLHLQGIAVRSNRVFLTTSARSGKIISARSDGPGKYGVDTPAVGFGRRLHPGGVQSIGHYLVIPVYGGGWEGIEIRDTSNHLALVKKFRTSRKPYCVGIATTRDADGEFYILAAVTQSDGSRVEVYRTPSNLQLTDPACHFELRWMHKAPLPASDPDKEWNGYPNNISLLSDTRGNVYFLGLSKTQVTGGEDWADLYHMDLVRPEQTMFRRLHRFHAKCHSAPAFRWGAGATVTGPDSIEIHACERNVQDNNSKIRVDVFAA